MSGVILNFSETAREIYTQATRIPANIQISGRHKLEIIATVAGLIYMPTAGAMLGTYLVADVTTDNILDRTGWKNGNTIKKVAAAAINSFVPFGATCAVGGYLGNASSESIPMACIFAVDVFANRAFRAVMFP